MHNCFRRAGFASFVEQSKQKELKKKAVEANNIIKLLDMLWPTKTLKCFMLFIETTYLDCFGIWNFLIVPVWQNENWSVCCCIYQGQSVGGSHAAKGIRKDSRNFWSSGKCCSNSPLLHAHFSVAAEMMSLIACDIKVLTSLELELKFWCVAYFELLFEVWRSTWEVFCMVVWY